MPVAFITAHDEEATRAQARDSGCVAYLRKPFPGSLLIDAIRSALQQAREGTMKHAPSRLATRLRSCSAASAIQFNSLFQGEQPFTAHRGFSAANKSTR